MPKSCVGTFRPGSLARPAGPGSTLSCQLRRRTFRSLAMAGLDRIKPPMKLALREAGLAGQTIEIVRTQEVMLMLIRARILEVSTAE